MRRNGDFFPVRREQGWGLSPWSEPRGFVVGSPWQTMRRMQEDMDRLFNQFVTPAGNNGGQQGEQAHFWAPNVDVSRAGNEWLVEAELPGVKKDDIEVHVVNAHLVLRAELRQEHQPQEGGEGQQRQYHQRERRYGYFQRVIALPQNVDDEQIRCEFNDGVLRVHVPALPEQPQGRRIPILSTTEQTGQSLQTGQAVESGAKGGEKTEKTKAGK